MPKYEETVQGMPDWKPSLRRSTLKSFNRNTPFDAFIIESLAGDFEDK
jgi:hypothetical protein